MINIKVLQFSIITGIQKFNTIFNTTHIGCHRKKLMIRCIGNMFDKLYNIFNRVFLFGEIVSAKKQFWRKLKLKNVFTSWVKVKKSTIFRDIYYQKIYGPSNYDFNKIIRYTFIQIDLAKKKLKIWFILKAYLEKPYILITSLL